MSSVITVIDGLMEGSDLKGKAIRAVPDPEISVYDEIRTVMASIDPKLGAEDAILSRDFLHKCEQYQQYLSDNIILNTEYCIIFLNPNHSLPPHILSEIIKNKIPIPQSAGNGHYKSFEDLYGTPESLIHQYYQNQKFR